MSFFSVRACVRAGACDIIDGIGSSDWGGESPLLHRLQREKKRSEGHTEGRIVSISSHGAPAQGHLHSERATPRGTGETVAPASVQTPVMGGGMAGEEEF